MQEIRTSNEWIDIDVKSVVLSDGSKVYNVQIGDLVLHATSKSDARRLSDKIDFAIKDHTIDRSFVGGEYDYDYENDF